MRAVNQQTPLTPALSRRERESESGLAAFALTPPDHSARRVVSACDE